MAVRKNYHLSNMSARNYNSKQIITLLLITVLIVATFVGAYLVQKQVLKLPFASSPTQSLGTATYNPASKPWQMHVIGNAKGSDGVRSMDINGDNFPDLVSGGEKGGRTDVFLHPGNINASKNKWQSVTVAKTPYVEDAVFADLDNDNSYDVISSTEMDDRKIYLSWGPKDKQKILDPIAWKTEILTESKGKTKWMYTFPIDLNKDGRIDIVAGSKGINAKLGWFESPQNPREIDKWVWHVLSDVNYIMSIFATDMDSDGDQDILISDRGKSFSDDKDSEDDLAIQGSVRWLENPGLEQLDNKWIQHYILENVHPGFITIADLDKDGLDDIVTAAKQRQILISKRLSRTGLDWTTYQIDFPNNFGLSKAVSVADIDLDGKNEIIVSTNNKYEGSENVFYLKNNLSTFQGSWMAESISGKLGIKYDLIPLIDVDKDGDLDVVTTEEKTNDKQGLGVIWFENPTR